MSGWGFGRVWLLAWSVCYAVVARSLCVVGVVAETTGIVLGGFIGIAVACSWFALAVVER